MDDNANAKPNTDDSIKYNAVYGVEKDDSVSGSTTAATDTTGSQAIFYSLERILQEFKEQVFLQSQEANQRLMQEFKEQVSLQSQEANQRLMQEFKDQLILETRRALQEATNREE